MRWAVAGAAAGCGVMMLRFGFTSLLPALCYLAVVAAPLTVIDIREQRLPDRLTLPSYPIAIALLALPNGRHRLESALLGLAVALAFYLLLALVHPAGIGWGDVKLSGVLGLYLGWFGARAFVAGLAGGFLLAGVAGVVLIAAGRATRKTQLPFGPFMLAGAVAAVLIFG